MRPTEVSRVRPGVASSDELRKAEGLFGRCKASLRLDLRLEP